MNRYSPWILLLVACSSASSTAPPAPEGPPRLRAIPRAFLAPIGFDSVRLRDEPSYQAPDGTRTEILPRQPAPDSGRQLRVMVTDEAVILTTTSNDAGGCTAPHSVRHWLVGDTLTIVTYDDAPAVCPMVYSPRDHSVRITGLRAGQYLVRYYAEGRGGRAGPGESSTPLMAVGIVVFER
jgi:hypothetical protein